MRTLFLLIVIVLTGGAMLFAIPTIQGLLTEPALVTESSAPAEPSPVAPPAALPADLPTEMASSEPPAEKTLPNEESLEPALPSEEELTAEAEKTEEKATTPETPLSTNAFDAPERDEMLFPLPAVLGPAVKFWTRIYSEVDTRGGLVHDNERMDIIYSQLDTTFDAFPEKTIERSLVYYRNILWDLAKGKRTDLSCDEQRVLTIWGGNPDATTLKAAAERVRFQRGQSERFLQGVNRSTAWRAFILKALEARGLPRELAALPHVESSFHPRAISHAGAAGLWQFMPGTGRRFMQVNEVVDERYDPFKASEGATQLLKYNHSILKSWPLALTAYNHGLSGVYGLTKRFSSSDIGELVRRSKGGKGMGFASRNFYASFLAALEVSDHPLRYFRAVRPRAPAEPPQLELKAFLPSDALAQSLGVEMDILKKHNPVLQEAVWNGSKYIPKGYRVVLPPDPLPAGLDEKLRLAEAKSGLDAQKPDLFYKVRPGDTLSTIAEKYQITTAELMAMNDLKDRKSIRAGQSLKLPNKNPSDSAALLAQNAAPAAPESTKTETNAKSAGEKTPSPESTTANEASPANPPAKAENPSETTTAEADEKAKTSEAAVDPFDYRVAADDTIEVQAVETLGHYAGWLEIPAARLKTANGKHFTLAIGKRVHLNFSKVGKKTFEQRRRAYHEAMRNTFFEKNRITSTQEHRVTNGDSLWWLAIKRYSIPLWLIRQYNPSLQTVGALPNGTLVKIPLVKKLADKPSQAKPVKAAGAGGKGVRG